MILYAIKYEDGRTRWALHDPNDRWFDGAPSRAKLRKAHGPNVLDGVKTVRLTIEEYRRKTTP